MGMKLFNKILVGSFLAAFVVMAIASLFFGFDICDDTPVCGPNGLFVTIPVALVLVYLVWAFFLKYLVMGLFHKKQK